MLFDPEETGRVRSDIVIDSLGLSAVGFGAVRFVVVRGSSAKQTQQRVGTALKLERFHQGGGRDEAGCHCRRSGPECDGSGRL